MVRNLVYSLYGAVECQPNMLAHTWPKPSETLSESYRAILVYALGCWWMNLMGLYEPYRVSQRHSAVGGECHPTPRGYRI